MNGIYLYLLLREIRDKLIGKHIEDIQIRRRIIQIIFNQHSLVVSLHPTTLGMFLAKNVVSGYEPLKAVADVVKACRVVDVLQDSFAPVMRMILEKPFPGRESMEIIVSFYHEAPNFSVRVGSWQKNIFTRFIEKEPKSSILDFGEEDIANMNVESMVKNIEGIDIRMAKFLDAKNLKILQSIVRGKAACPRLVSSQPLCISLFADDGATEFSSLDELFKHAIMQFSEETDDKHAEQERRLQIRRLKRRISRLQKKLLPMKEIEFFRECGELILANMAEVKKGHLSVELQSPYTRKSITVKLDPRLTPQANAQKYFLKYKKEKRGQPRLREQLVSLEKEMAAVGKKPGVIVREKKETGKTTLKREPFHKFNLDSGSVVFVGKSARSNDQLTFQQARSGDYFFHARGVEGAHTILRPNIPKRQRPGKDEIRIAAAIAAYFSKARTQRNVPVSYTQRKYLKKDKKGKPGAVMLMREEVVFVDPGLPT
ncbi:MAG: NFACT RNA binding domain-containing protein [candidate division WOR-3 bacterium]|nr:NFACT RNA binding domain-containing protein [candidate division WOR-3 bacterium]